MLPLHTEQVNSYKLTKHVTHTATVPPLRLLHLSKSQAQLLNFLHCFISVLIMDELASKKCVPCNSKDIRPMSEELANELITKVPEWTLVNEGEKLKLSRSWKVKTFIKGLEFLQAIADVAEAEGGLTENDFVLAAKIDNLDVLAHLLRIKPAK